MGVTPRRYTGSGARRSSSGAPSRFNGTSASRSVSVSAVQAAGGVKPVKWYSSAKAIKYFALTPHTAIYETPRRGILAHGGVAGIIPEDVINGIILEQSGFLLMESGGYLLQG